MNKHLLATILITAYIFMPLTVEAQTRIPTKSPTPTLKISPSGTKISTPSSSLSPTSSEQSDIDTLKEKVANKVAQLSKQNHKAAAGYVTTIKGDQITITSREDTKHTIKADLVLTKVFQISAGKKTEIKYEDIEKNDYIIISGPTIGDTINANVIYVDERLEVRDGKVAEIDAINSTIKVISTEKDNYTLNVLRTTKISLIDSSTLAIEKTTLAKMKEGDTIHFTYSHDPESKEEFTVDTQKIVIIPQEYFQK